MLSYLALASGLALGSAAIAEDPTLAPGFKVEDGQALYVVPASATINAKPTVVNLALPLTADCYPTAPEALNALGTKSKELLDKVQERLKEIKSTIEPKDVETANLVASNNEEHEWVDGGPGRPQKWGRTQCKKEGKKWHNHRASYTLKIRLKALDTKEKPEEKDLTAKLANSSFINASVVLATYAEIVGATANEEWERAPYVYGGQQRTTFDNTKEEKAKYNQQALIKANQSAFAVVIQSAMACPDMDLEAFRKGLKWKYSELQSAAYRPQFDSTEAAPAMAPSMMKMQSGMLSAPPPVLPTDLSYTATFNVKIVGPALVCPSLDVLGIKKP